MAILNPSFEDAGPEPGMAEHWTLATSVAGQRIAGFGPTPHRAWEDFERWFELRLSFPPGSLALAFFDPIAEGWINRASAKLVVSDRIHPNQQGYDYIVAHLAPAIKKALKAAHEHVSIHCTKATPCRRRAPGKRVKSCCRNWP